jgi:transposase
MTRRSFDVIDVVEILQHWHAGRAKTQVAESVGVDRGTVRRYVARAVEAGHVAGGPPLTRAEWASLVQDWFPELTDARARSLTYPVIVAFRDTISELLDEVTVTTAWQRCRDEHGLQVGLTSFRQFVQLEFPDRGLDQTVTVLRPPVEPGSEAQIDYGFLGSWTDPVTQRLRRVWGFVIVLACSRHMFVRPVLRLDSEAWVAAHVSAFEFFGCVPARLVIDNLRTGVDRPDLYDPKLNRAYAELGEHYGCLIDPARASKPKDKPRVERPMPYVRDSFWRGRSWDSIETAQSAAVDWCMTVAGVRRHRGLDGAAPLAVFNAIEAPAMRALPHFGFELASWSNPKVATDCHVSVNGVLYSVPWKWVGRRVDARCTQRIVEIFVDTNLVKTHVRLARGRSTDMADYPPNKIAFFQRTPVWCRHRAAELGEHVTVVIAELIDTNNALHRLRSAQGIIGLADKHDAIRLNHACRRAVAVGDVSYRTIRGILAAGTENDDQTDTPPAQTPAHLHGPGQLFNPDDVTEPDGNARTVPPSDPSIVAYTPTQDHDSGGVA